MTDDAALTRSGFAQRITGHLRVPLYRNGYSLAFSTVASSVLGVVFWLVAARMLPAEVVGIDSALISAGTLLGTIAQLNLTHGLNRFLPRAGRASGSLVARAYAVTAALGVIVAIIYLLGINVWSPSLAFVAAEPWLAFWFVLSTAMACVFALQDGALTGLRRAGWVPVENIAYGVAKLGLLAGLVVAGVRSPVFLAWTVPHTLLIAGVTWLLFKRLLPEHVRTTADRERPLDWRHVRRFVAGDYLAALMSTGMGSVLPILVLELTDAVASAYFALAWSIAYTLFLLSRNMGMSLVAEVVNDESRLDEYSAGIVAQSVRLLALPVAVLVIAAPLVLRVFGPDYAAGGATLLRLLALSVFPGIIVSLFMAIARIQRRMRVLVAVMAVLNGGVLALSLLLVPRLGITGVGVAWLGMQTATAVGLAATELRALWISRLDHRLLGVAVRMVHRLTHHRSRRRRTDNISAVLPAVAGALAVHGAPRLRVVHPTVNSVSVAEVEVPGVGPVVVKVAEDRTGGHALDRERRALLDLAADEAVAASELTLPRLLAAGHHDGRRWIVERLLGGGSTDPAATGPAAEPDDALRVVTALHRATARQVPVDRQVLEVVVDRPLDLIAASRGARGAHATLARLRSELHADLRAQRIVTLSRIHGDLTPHNFVVRDARIVGLIDWEDTVAGSLPAIDTCHYAITWRMARSGRELGDVVVRLLRDPRSLSGLPGGPLAIASGLPERTVVLTTWLHHIAAVIAKSSRAARSPVWHARNVTAVLTALQIVDRDTAATTETG